MIRYFFHFLLFACAFTFFVPFAAEAAEKSRDRDIVITLPAETVLHSLQKMLPLEINTDNPDLQGQITLQSLKKLAINDNTLSIQGVVGGKNLSMVTTIANQKIRLKLGEVHLPVSCDLRTRFDKGKQQLFVTPFFPAPEQSTNGSNAIRPLLKALEGQEYPLQLDTLKLSNFKLGEKPFPLTMVPVDITGRDNALMINLQPQPTP